jgi:RNA polymerase sigma-70 factor (ECF subfamily)
LYRIGVNQCLSRRSVREPATEPLDEREIAASREPDAVSRLLAGERAARVRAAIARLPDRQRATLILRAYHDLSHQEIADILGSSEGAVKASFFHALRSLRKLLSGEPQ